MYLSELDKKALSLDCYDPQEWADGAYKEEDVQKKILLNTAKIESEYGLIESAVFETIKDYTDAEEANNV